MSIKIVECKNFRALFRNILLLPFSSYFSEIKVFDSFVLNKREIEATRKKSWRKSKKRYIGGVERNLKSLGINDWKEIVLDKDRWQRVALAYRDKKKSKRVQIT